MPALGFHHYRSADDLSVELFSIGSGTILNTGGDPLAEVANGYYEATITESVAGSYIARILRDGDVIYLGHANFNGSDSAVVDDFPRYLDAAVSSRMPAGSVGDAQETSVQQVLAAVQSLPNSLMSSQVVSIAVPRLGSQGLDAPIVQGDCYLAAHGRAIDIARTDFPDLPDGTTAVMSGRLEGSLSSEPTFAWPGSILVATGAKQLRFELTSEQTRNLPAGKYEFDVQVVLPDGNTLTFVGPAIFLRVIADVSTP